MSDIATDWHARARSLSIEARAFVDGRYVPAASGATFDCVSPIDGRVLAQVASTDSADADRAVGAARRAFESGVWSRQSPCERKRVLQRFAELILAHRDELALLETLDMGKPISDSLAVDIPATARCIAWYAEAIRQALRRGRAHGAQCTRADHARADRSGGRDRAVELLAHHGGVEDRPGARENRARLRHSGSTSSSCSWWSSTSSHSGWGSTSSAPVPR